MEEVVKYYSNLYKEEKHDTKNMSNYIGFQNINKLSNENKELCDGLITEEECKRAVFAMQKNKTPGSDGISIEFFQVFWPQVKTLVVEALNECYSTGVMSDTQKKGLITLLFKKGDAHDLKNWRPITLLNYDYNIMAAVLAEGYRKSLGKLYMKIRQVI